MIIFIFFLLLIWRFIAVFDLDSTALEFYNSRNPFRRFVHTRINKKELDDLLESWLARLIILPIIIFISILGNLRALSILIIATVFIVTLVSGKEQKVSTSYDTAITSPTTDYTHRTKTEISLRECPNVECSKYTDIPQNTRLRLYNCERVSNGYWCEVEYRGQIGYCTGLSQYVEEL